jgi:hypothetical protein
LIGFPVVAVLLAIYAGWSNCADIRDAAARAACGDSSGGVVTGMTLGFLLLVWLVAPFALGVLVFLVKRVSDVLSAT